MTNGTTFDDLGRVTGRSMSTTTAGTVATFVRDYGYHAPTGLVDRLKAGWNNGTSTSWFADDTITRDTAGRVTQIVDAGVEPDGSPSAVKECFVYDHQHRLVRAHTATSATGCATSTTSTSVAPGSRDPYDTVWGFDDLQRITSRTDQMTAATTTYQYGGVGPHAVTGLTGATTATYSYNPVGEMVGRDGTTLAWDPLGRLTANGTTTSIYGSGPERLIHTAGSTRTLTLPGIDVVDQAGVRTVTRQITLAGTLVALTTNSQVWWNCANLSNTITCQTPTATTLTPPVPARKRFGPYGTPRNTTVFAHTDRGYLGAPHDPQGLVHLQHRHLDPRLGVFISVDPLVGKTRQPYLYANGNPTTLTDPTGLTPCDPREEFGCGPLMDKPERICAVAPNWPGCAQKPPPAKEGQKWVDTCQGAWTHCNQLVTDGFIYDDPAAWHAYVGLVRLQQLGYLDVRGAQSPQAYLFANTSVLPNGYDNFKVLVESRTGGLVFGVIPVSFTGPFEGCGWRCAVATITTALLASGAAGAACVFTVGLGCGAAVFAAVGTTSAVYESTSSPNADLGDLACSFVFGPRNTYASLIGTLASGGMTAATQGGRAAVVELTRGMTVGSAREPLCG